MKSALMTTALSQKKSITVLYFKVQKKGQNLALRATGGLDFLRREAPEFGSVVRRAKNLRHEAPEFGNAVRQKILRSEAPDFGNVVRRKNSHESRHGVRRKLFLDAKGLNLKIR